MGEKVELSTVTILGREVAFKQFTDTQLVLAHRMRQMLVGVSAQLPTEDSEDRQLTEIEQRAMLSGLDTTARFLDMLGYNVATDEDREWLTQQMLAGNIDLTEISRFVQELVPSDKRDKTPAKKAVRARARR